MKVLHISSPKSWRGGEQQLIYLAEELKQQGIEQIIMCPFNSPVHKYCLKKHLAHVTYFKGFSANPMVAFRVAQVCKRDQIDLIHVHDSHAHNFAILSTVITKNDLPIVVSRRVDFPIQGSSISLFKYNHPKIKRIICVSGAIKHVMESFIQDREKLCVVHSGIDLAKFSGKVGDKLRTEFKVPIGYKIIGNVSALAPHKDYKTFLETARILLDRGVTAKFFAIGEGKERKQIENWIEEFKLEDDVILTGFRKDIIEVLPELDLFLITSKTEGLGTSILDALASKVPVVATSAGGIVEVIVHEKNGLLCEVQHQEQLADAVFRLLNDEQLQAQYREAGWEKVKSFSKSVTATKTRAIYEEVLSESSSEDASEKEEGGL